MKCPHCKKDMHLPSYANRNMESYQNGVVVNTLCCGKAVYAWPVITFNAEKYSGEAMNDDWGAPINKEPVPA